MKRNGSRNTKQRFECVYLYYYILYEIGRMMMTITVNHVMMSEFGFDCNLRHTDKDCPVVNRRRRRLPLT